MVALYLVVIGIGEPAATILGGPFAVGVYRY
jgi:hypothetical protein